MMQTSELEQLKFRPNTADSGARLLLEPLVDTGSAVPIGVLLKAPSGLLIESFEIFAPENPVTRVLELRFGKPQTRYQLETRIRLGLAQDVWLVAKLTDGSLMGTKMPTVITSSACFDATD